jgi:hypothetical protein
MIELIHPPCPPCRGEKKDLLRIYLLIFFILFNIPSLSFSQDSLNVKTDKDNCDVSLFRSINNYRTPFLNSFLNITDRSMLPAAIIVPSTLMLYGRLDKKTYEENTGY